MPQRLPIAAIVLALSSAGLLASPAQAQLGLDLGLGDDGGGLSVGGISVGGTVEDVVEGVGDTVSNTVGGAVGGVGNAVEGVGGAVGGAVGGVGGAVEGALGGLSPTGEGGQPAAIPAVVPLDQNVALQAVKSRRALPLERIMTIARLETDGEIIDAKLIQVGEFLLYELKVLEADGDVNELYFYARSGERVQIN